TLLVPIILSLFLYYLLKPIYKFFLKVIKKELPSILATFLLLFLLLGILVQEIVPLLMEQINTLTQNLPQLIGELDKVLTGFNITATEDISYYLDMINHSFEDLINLLFIGLKS